MTIDDLKIGDTFRIVDFNIHDYHLKNIPYMLVTNNPSDFLTFCRDINQDMAFISKRRKIIKLNDIEEFE